MKNFSKTFLGIFLSVFVDTMIGLFRVLIAAAAILAILIVPVYFISDVIPPEVIPTDLRGFLIVAWVIIWFGILISALVRSVQD